MSSDSESEDEQQTVANDLVVTKYKMAAEIVNGTLKKLVALCIADASVLTICEYGDRILNEETSKVFKKEKEMKKGIAFPTCISVNNCICHFSPLKSEADITLRDGDLVKIDIGAHIDGFPALVAHTLVVGGTKENRVSGRKADVMLAAHYASEIALRMVKPGNQNIQVTDAITQIAEAFDCKPVEGMLSYQMKQHSIDGKKSIILNPSEGQRSDHEKAEFKLHEVYAMDVLISTGDGKSREQDARTTVFKKNDIVYQLKMKTSRQFFSDVDKQFSSMPFNLRAFDDEKKAKMGVIECVKHELLTPYIVLFEKEGELVAQFKFTMLLMPNGPMKITGQIFDTELYQSEFSVKDERLKELLAEPVTRRAVKKKKKKAEKAALQDVEIATGTVEAGEVI